MASSRLAQMLMACFTDSDEEYQGKWSESQGHLHKGRHDGQNGLWM